MFDNIKKKAQDLKLAGQVKATRALMKKQGVPDEQIDLMVGMIERNPDLFKKMGEEIKAKKKAGKSETVAAMEVSMKYKGELQKLQRQMMK